MLTLHNKFPGPEWWSMLHGSHYYAIMLVSCHVALSLRLVWKSGTCRWNLQVSDLQTSGSDLNKASGYYSKWWPSGRLICPITNTCLNLRDIDSAQLWEDLPNLNTNQHQNWFFQMRQNLALLIWHSFGQTQDNNLSGLTGQRVKEPLMKYNNLNMAAIQEKIMKYPN